MKIITVLGARPQFIKAAPLSEALRKRHEEKIVHTGQHYDYQMSDVFFEELGIPKPDYFLGVGSKQHGAQTGEMLTGVEEVLLKEKPDWVLVYGDTNSTLAGALAASKLHIPIAHVEAGLRSYNRLMPEEVNRVLTDHVSTLMFCPTDQAVKNLSLEGLTKGVVRTGDVMADALYYHARRAEERSMMETLRYPKKSYLLATVHRAENTDDPSRLAGIINAFAQIEGQIVLPLHPRTRKLLQDHRLTIPENVEVIEPVGYLEMILLEKEAELILTDSGGVQKEAYLWKVPCVTLRDETEWVETVQTGWNTLTGAKTEAIVDTVKNYRNQPLPPYLENLYGNGRASEEIVAQMEKRG
ncbi:non-hydrolyzing UDP-N-acetylglucosamine 2-epimerase [Desulfosporosinus sp.]|uniref:non-hydrolyzing UDP-N-acetylglucosamine 2-epimerase n=1 Tax=Desulfosporosinus sp. TaxID=157907 RepID=UPI0025BA1174|nr:UDP-N-acetylglucosamine 2-epimerase (non-hydrolyzing) [Desulfosporosinus sp.]MBC2721500.1 UDP-N-acetylglucosamine 2-epimerase (non-hydrolyzing) [Desulfosporosinus sp.]MBC2726375.1 UDP-N-acetylglucosamine 2-epimerase (non-hydrolyzing) [Desulfosporosinus sp.]